MQFGNVGHLLGIGINVGLPLFLLCVGRALMMSCTVVSIAGFTVGGSAWHRRTRRFGRIRMVNCHGREALNTDWDKGCVRMQRG